MVRIFYLIGGEHHFQNSLGKISEIIIITNFSNELMIKTIRQITPFYNSITTTQNILYLIIKLSRTYCGAYF